MKRDWDVIREILQKTEELSSGQVLSSDDFQEERRRDVNYNAMLLGEAALVKIEFSEKLTDDFKDFWVSNLTWEGHDFLKAMESESVWKKTKDKIIEKGGAMTFDILKEVLKVVAVDFVKSTVKL